jgi:hypothetical protein
MIGYDMWGERSWGGGKRVHCCVRRHGYSSAVMMAVECFFRRPGVLWDETVVRRFWARSVWGVVGGQDDVTIFGRMW